jgi:hypothetical protein
VQDEKALTIQTFGSECDASWNCAESKTCVTCEYIQAL